MELTSTNRLFDLTILSDSYEIPKICAYRIVSERRSWICSIVRVASCLQVLRAGGVICFEKCLSLVVSGGSEWAGDVSDKATLVPIPNTTVKLVRADGTDSVGNRESRLLPVRSDPYEAC
jgi:hypothetical protein